MAARIEGARYAVIPGAGHLMHRERPDAFNELVLGFLAKAFPATP
jgi:pimeloyl-ACP methyl ester carboxylesterase